MTSSGGERVAAPALLIGGELVGGDGAALEIENPALGEVFESVALPSEEQVDAAIAAAPPRARPAWLRDGKSSGRLRLESHDLPGLSGQEWTA